MSVTNPTREPEQETQGAPATAEQPSNPVGLAVLAVIVIGGTALAAATGSLLLVLFIIGIVAMVTLHEAGHYVVAKKAGMKVTQFFFGFGPRLWSFRKGETEYGIKAFPLGGYVKIIGMSNVERDIDPVDEPRTYRQQSYPKRVAVALAGPATHFIVAFVALIFIFSVVGIPSRDAPNIGSITPDSAAQKAGIQVGDHVVSVDGQPVDEWTDVPPLIREKPGQPVTLVVQRGGRDVTLIATPEALQDGDKTVGFLGVGPQAVIERTNPVVAAGRSVKWIGEYSVTAVTALGSFFSPSSLEKYAENFTGEPEPSAAESRPVSVVGAVRLADQAAAYDFRLALELFIVLNIFIAILNLLPLPPFDGGHVAIATYERIRSRRGRQYRADVNKLMPVTAVVVVFFLLLGLSSIFLDIFNPVANPFQ